MGKGLGFLFIGIGLFLVYTEFIGEPILNLGIDVKAYAAILVAFFFVVGFLMIIYSKPKQPRY